MSLTVSQVIERARERYHAVNDAHFSDKMLRAAIFSAQEELAKASWCIEETFTTTSTSGTRTLTWPANCLAIKELKYDYKTLSKESITADPKTSSTGVSGTPTKYAIWDNEIILFPTPDTTGDTITVRVFKYPQDVSTDTTTLEVPDEYHDDLINYVLAQMAIKDRNIPLYREYLAAWNISVEKATEQRAKRLRSDRPTRVKDHYWGTDTRYSSEDIFYDL